MTPWQRARHQFRCYLVETPLDWALALVPKGTKEEIALAIALRDYCNAIQQSTREQT